MRKDYKDAKIYDIAKGDLGYYHFIFKKGKKYFGIKVHPSEFTTMEYKEVPKGQGRIEDYDKTNTV